MANYLLDNKDFQWKLDEMKRNLDAYIAELKEADRDGCVKIAGIITGIDDCIAIMETDIAIEDSKELNA